VTALAASRFGLPVNVAPLRANPETKRASIAWAEPEPWIVAVLLVTGVAVIGRHPIARAIGTEADDSTMTPSVVATAPPSAAPSPAAKAAMAAPAPTHAPRNPFRALVDASGAMVAPEIAKAAAAEAASTTTKAHHSHAAASPSSVPVAAAGSATCAGTVHTVVAGDSLWSLAATMVKSNDTGKINVVWHRIYEANTPPLGSNPSLLPVGTKLCLPSKA
jgi:nucleoid-associated protein YgaU